MIKKIEFEDKQGIQNDEDVPRKNKVMDDDMNEIKEVVNSNADELTSTDTRVDNLETDNTENKSDINILNDKVAELESDNSINKTNIKNLQNDNTTNKSNIQVLQIDNETNKTDIANLKSDNTLNKTNISNLQSDNNTNKTNIKNLQADNTTNKADIGALKSDNETNKTDIENIENDMLNLQKEVQKNVFDLDKIDLLSIDNRFLKTNTISLNKIITEIDLLEKAIEICRNQVATGYSTSTKQTTFKDSNTITAVKFNIEDITGAKFYVPLPENAIQLFILEKEDLSSAVNFENESEKDSPKRPIWNTNYDKETRIFTFSLDSNYDGYDYVVINLDNNNLYMYSQNNNDERLNNYISNVSNKTVFSKNLIRGILSGNQVNLGSTDLLQYPITIHKNCYLRGYSAADYTIALYDDDNYFTVEIPIKNISNNVLDNIFIKAIDNPPNPNFFVALDSINKVGANLTYTRAEDANAIEDNFINLNKIPSTAWTNFKINNRENGKIFITLKYSDFYSYSNLIYANVIDENNPNYNLLLTKESNIPSFIVNKNFKVLQNNNLFIYPQNIAKNINVNDCNLVTATNCDFSNNNLIGFTNVQSNINSNLQIYPSNNNLKYDADINIEIVPTNAGANQTKKILFIGDSLTAADVYLQKLTELFNNENEQMNIELVGTLGDYKMEGRSGWRAYTYTHCANGSDESTADGFYQGSNAFWNPETNKFDFSYYMNNNSFSSIDYVFICLGTNDLSRGNYKSEEEIISYYNEIINSIKEFNSNVVIGLWLPVGRGLQNKLNALLSLFDAQTMNQYLINNFENKENDNIYLVPTNVAINPFEDYNTTAIQIEDNKTIDVVSDSVHPNQSGYYKIAKVFYYWIKYFASL